LQVGESTDKAPEGKNTMELFRSAYHGNINQLQLLLEEGIDVNLVDSKGP
jgi:hypothetical protein